MYTRDDHCCLWAVRQRARPLDVKQPHFVATYSPLVQETHPNTRTTAQIRTAGRSMAVRLGSYPGEKTTFLFSRLYTQIHLPCAVGGTRSSIMTSSSEPHPRDQPPQAHNLLRGSCTILDRLVRVCTYKVDLPCMKKLWYASPYRLIITLI